MQQLFWHPARDNPLDYLESGLRKLVDRNGNPVVIRKLTSGGKFTIQIADQKPIEVHSNLEACYCLNRIEVVLDTDYMNWLNEVDKEIVTFGLDCTHSDLIGEYPWREWFEGGVTPKVATAEALYNEGFFEEENKVDIPWDIGFRTS